MATLYENYTTGDSNYIGIYGSSVTGQTFTPSVSHWLTSVKLKLGITGTPPTTLYVAIKATSSGVPTGDAISTGSIASSTITEDTFGGWHEITMSSVLLSASTMYAILVYTSGGGNSSNRVIVRYDHASSTYANGTWLLSGTTIQSDKDMVFEEYGYPNTIKTFTADSYIQDTFTKTFTAGGIIWQLNASLDAILIADTSQWLIPNRNQGYYVNKVWDEELGQWVDDNELAGKSGGRHQKGLVVLSEDGKLFVETI